MLAAGGGEGKRRAFTTEHTESTEIVIYSLFNAEHAENALVFKEKTG
mgnify:FL=1